MAILKCVFQSEMGQSEKPTSYAVQTIWHSGKDKVMETVQRLMVVRGWC